MQTSSIRRNSADTAVDAARGENRRPQSRINAARSFGGLPPLTADHPDLQPKTYTAYKLVCEVDNLLDGDFQTLTRIADRHNCSLGAEALGDKVLLQLAFVR